MVLEGERRRTAAIIWEPLHFSPSPIESLQSLP